MGVKEWTKGKLVRYFVCRLLVVLLLPFFGGCERGSFVPYYPPTMEKVKLSEKQNRDLEFKHFRPCFAFYQEKSTKRLWSSCEDGFSSSDDGGVSWSRSHGRFESTPSMFIRDELGASWILDNKSELWTADRIDGAWRKLSVDRAALEGKALDRILWDEARQRLVALTSDRIVVLSVEQAEAARRWESLAKVPPNSGSLSFAVPLKNKSLLFLTDAGKAFTLDSRRDQLQEFKEWSAAGIGKGAVWNRHHVAGSPDAGWYFHLGKGEVLKLTQDMSIQKIAQPLSDSGGKPYQLTWDQQRQRPILVTQLNDYTSSQILLWAMGPGNQWSRLLPENEQSAATLAFQQFLPFVDLREKSKLIGRKGARIRIDDSTYTLESPGSYWGGEVKDAVASSDKQRHVLVLDLGFVVRTADGGRSWVRERPLGNRVLSMAATPDLNTVWLTDGGQVVSASPSQDWAQHSKSVGSGFGKLAFDPVAGKLYGYNVDGLFVFSGANRTWERLTLDTRDNIQDILFAPDGSSLLVITDKSIFVRRGEGEPFKALRLPFPALEASAASSIGIDGAAVVRIPSGWALWVTVRDKSDHYDQKYLSRTVDLKTWKTLKLSKYGRNGANNFFALADSETLLGTSYTIGRSGPQAFYSLDGGFGWQSIGGYQDSTRVRLMPNGSDVLFFGSTERESLQLFGEAGEGPGIYGFIRSVNSSPTTLESFKSSFPASVRPYELDLRFNESGACKAADLNVELEYRRPGTEEFQRLPEPPKMKVDGNTIQLSFSPASINLQRGNRFELQVQTKCLPKASKVVEASYYFGPFTVGSWYEDIPGGLKTLVIVLALLCVPLPAVLLYWIRPATLLRLRNIAWVDVSAMLPSYIAWIPKGLMGMLLIPWLTTRPRVINAWAVRHQAAFANKLKEHPTAQRSARPYIPLPLILQTRSSEQLVEKPDKRTITTYLHSIPSLVDIVGGGGAGKTRLCLEIFNWLSTPDESNRLRPVAGIWLDEAIKDLAVTLDNHIANAVGKPLDAAFRNAALKSGALLVIVDRFSEQSDETRQQLTRLWTELDAGFAIVTRRSDSDALGKRAPSLTLKPQPLDKFLLPGFLSNHLRNIDDEETSVFGESEPADIVAHFSRIVGSTQVHPHAQTVVVTPLLVTLFAATAFGLRKKGRPLDELPTSFPELYFKYVVELDLADRQGAPIGDIKLRQYLVALGKLCLDPVKLLVQRMSLNQARNSLMEVDSKVNPEDVLRRLEKSGVIQSTILGISQSYRFQLDPMAEFFGLFAIAEACGGQDYAWTQLVERIAANGERAEALETTLSMIRSVYAAENGWAAPLPQPQRQ